MNRCADVSIIIYELDKVLATLSNKLDSFEVELNDYQAYVNQLNQMDENGHNEYNDDTEFEIHYVGYK